MFLNIVFSKIVLKVVRWCAPNSQGFSNLFTLLKEDLEETLKYYPDAKRILNAKARRLMKENEARSAKERVAHNNNGRSNPPPLPPEDEGVLFRPRALAERKDPGLLEAVLKVMPADSMTQVYLRRGSSRAGSLTSRRAATSSSLDNPAASAALPRLSRGSQASLGTLSSARQPRALSSPHTREGSQSKELNYTVKKGYRFSSPQPGCH